MSLRDAFKRPDKVPSVMREFKKGTLNIGKSKMKVKSKKQAVRIALEEARGQK